MYHAAVAGERSRSAGRGAMRAATRSWRNLPRTIGLVHALHSRASRSPLSHRSLASGPVQATRSSRTRWMGRGCALLRAALVLLLLALGKGMLETEASSGEPLKGARSRPPSCGSGGAAADLPAAVAAAARLTSAAGCICRSLSRQGRLQRRRIHERWAGVDGALCRLAGGLGAGPPPPGSPSAFTRRRPAARARTPRACRACSPPRPPLRPDSRDGATCVLPPLPLQNSKSSLCAATGGSACGWFRWAPLPQPHRSRSHALRSAPLAPCHRRCARAARCVAHPPGRRGRPPPRRPLPPPPPPPLVQSNGNADRSEFNYRDGSGFTLEYEGEQIADLDKVTGSGNDAWPVLRKDRRSPCGCCELCRAQLNANVSGGGARVDHGPPGAAVPCSRRQQCCASAPRRPG